MKMNKYWLAGVFVLLSFNVNASETLNYRDYAVVVDSVPNYSEAQTREECTESYQPRRSTGAQDKGLAGPIIGGVAGGLLGNTVGKGGGKKAATVVGAITGAVVGDRLQSRDRSDEQILVRTCRDVQIPSSIVNYTLWVRYNGREMKVLSEHDANVGQRVPVIVNVSVEQYENSMRYRR